MTRHLIPSAWQHERYGRTGHCPELYNHDINRLSTAIEESKIRSKHIATKIAKIHEQVISVIPQFMSVSFKNIATIEKAVANAHDIKICHQYGILFREALIDVNPAFARIVTQPVDKLCKQLDVIYDVSEEENLRREAFEMQMVSEKFGLVYDDNYPNDVKPALTPIESCSKLEKLASNRGTMLRVCWENDPTTDAVNPDFSAATLNWISISGQELFDYIDEVLRDFPVNVTNFEFDVLKNIHGQFLVCGGVNKFHISPHPTFVYKCMQALGFQCTLTPIKDEEATISIRW